MRVVDIISLVLLLAVAITVEALSLQGSSLPTQLTDAEFWNVVTEFSEAGGAFQYENFVSNEITYPAAMSAVVSTVKPGGVFVGVGPEQNFTYIAAFKPKMAFVVDIRRQNLLELLLYQELFRTSADRADFLSNLFARKRPSGLSDSSSVNVLFDAYSAVPEDSALLASNLNAIVDRIGKSRGFSLAKEDFDGIEKVYRALADGGPGINYAFRSQNIAANGQNTYASLMTVADSSGKQWSYLASEAGFQFVRDMQKKNLIVPLVGDFAGAKAIQSIGKYVKVHEAAVTVFYASNVEEYLRPDRAKYLQYCANVASLPVLPESTFIRWAAGNMPRTFLNPMGEFIRAFQERRPFPYEIAGPRGNIAISCH